MCTVISLLGANLLDGCAINIRSAASLPPQLHTLYFEPINPDSHFSVALMRELKSLDVQFTHSAQKAPYILHILSNNWQFSHPSLLYSGDANQYTYALTVSYQLETNAGQVIYGPQTATISRSRLINTNQLYIEQTNQLMKRELTQEITILIYNQLSSNRVKQALVNQTLKSKSDSPHAASSKTAF